LSGEQLDAGILALSSSDRVVVIQGVAGAGKTTLISAMAETAKSEGRQVLGLAQANTMVEMLKSDAGIEAQTVSSFVNQHLRAALAGQGETFAASQAALKDTMLVLDEASLVANKPMNDLVTIANRLGLDRLVMIGDRAQLQPIDAGKAFTLIQQHRPAMAKLDVSHRQRTEHMKAVAALTRSGHFKDAFGVLGERVVGVGADFREAAARKWLELSVEDRERTALYASGRETRTYLNAFVQEGLKAEGALHGDGLAISRLESVNLTREELRYASNYRAGQVLEVVSRDRSAGLDHGTYDVVGVSAKGIVSLRDADGKRARFRPDRIDPNDRRDHLALSERETLRLHDGDRIRWTANDKARGLFNSASADVIAITREGVEVRTSEGVNMVLAYGDKMLSRLGLAYAINMHQAQGMTTDQGIGVMHSAERHLSNQRLTHVMATRVRDDLTIFTNDRDALLRSIDVNPGDKASALDHIGKTGPQGSSGISDGEKRVQTSAEGGRPGVAFGIDPASIRSRPEGQPPHRNRLSPRHRAREVDGTGAVICAWAKSAVPTLWFNAKADGGHVSAGTNLASFRSYRTWVTVPLLILEMRSLMAWRGTKNHSRGWTIRPKRSPAARSSLAAPSALWIRPSILLRLMLNSWYSATTSTSASKNVGSLRAFAMRCATLWPVTPILWISSRCSAT
jgi:hypothetical protein